jgi:hypothetical protein
MAPAGGRPVATHHAADWGMGALLMAMMLVILFPLVLAGVILIPLAARDGLVHDVQLITTLADVVGYGVVGLAILAVLFSLVGLISGFVRRQPVGLPTCALVVSVVSLVLWIVIFVGIQAVKRDIQFQDFRDRSIPIDRRFGR